MNCNLIPTGRRPRAAALLLLIAPIMGSSCATPSWNQWGGPNRDFTAPPVKLADTWPEGGPKVLWSKPLGDGFASIVGNGQHIYGGYRGANDEEIWLCLDAADGSEVWRFACKAPFVEGAVEEPDEKNGKITRKVSRQVTEFGTGPNATPLLVNDRLFVIGFTGRMHCLSASHGQVIWSRDLYKELGGSYQQFGWAASPLAYRDTVIVLLGGQGHGVVALRQHDGEMAWKSTSLDSSYSSPILVNVDGHEHLVAYMASDVVGLSPATGQDHWSLPHANIYKSSIATPISCPGNRVYVVNGGDTAGGLLLRLVHRDGRIVPDEVWKNSKLRGGLNNAVRVGQYLYGPNSAGEGASFMVCVDLNNGEIKWRNREIPGAAPIYADGKLIMLDQDGHLFLARPSPEALEILSKVNLLEKPSWTTPTLIGTKLFVRDKKTIMALELAAS